MSLAFAPIITPEPRTVTGMVLLGFALGWALLAVLTTWLSDQPQRWAAAPAAFMGLASGVVLLAPDALADGVLGWVWPPALLALVLWTFTRARRQLHRRARGWLLNPVLVVLALISLGGAYETIGASLTAAPVMHGQLVAVRQHRLHLDCTGSRGPTVVLEPGAGATSSDVAWVAGAVARESRVCVYDRAGRGWSDPATGTPDGAQIATDLHTLLHRAHVPGPYVLVGHSFGGLYVRSFAAQYPQDVAGLVLVDSTASRSTPVPPQRVGSYDLMGRLSAILSASSRLGLGRVVARLSYADLPAESRDAARAHAATAAQIGSTVDEYANAARSMSEAGRLVDLGSKPLVVLTAGQGNDETWQAVQDQLATLSADSVHRVVAGATHDSLLADRHDSSAVSRAVHDVVTSVRTATPLVGP